MQCKHTHIHTYTYTFKHTHAHLPPRSLRCSSVQQYTLRLASVMLGVSADVFSALLPRTPHVRLFRNSSNFSEKSSKFQVHHS